MSHEKEVKEYLDWITPKIEDPTHSLLKAHLLFERLFDEFFHRQLPNPEALKGARLTFAQKLALAKALAKDVAASDWRWQATARLNKLRNSLAHSPGPELHTEVQAYVDFYTQHTNTPLPTPEVTAPQGHYNHSYDQPLFRLVDVATLGLYIDLSFALGLGIEKFATKK